MKKLTQKQIDKVTESMVTALCEALNGLGFEIVTDKVINAKANTTKAKSSAKANTTKAKAPKVEKLTDDLSESDKTPCYTTIKSSGETKNIKVKNARTIIANMYKVQGDALEKLVAKLLKDGYLEGTYKSITLGQAPVTE